MDYLKGIDSFGGLASIYSFDILPDGKYSEIRIMAVNHNNAGVLASNPDAPAFYPGIPWRTYFSEINHEKLCYKCGIENTSFYSYVNAHNFWIKGFYLPITPPDEVIEENKKSGKKTIYLLYIMERTKQLDSSAMSKRSSDVSEAVINLSLKLHESQDFVQSMADTMKEIRQLCGSEICSLYTVDKNTKQCSFINENGMNQEFLINIGKSMGRTPYETAIAWEDDLAGSDCFLLEDLSVIKERDPLWYESMNQHGITSIILYAIRFNHDIVGFLWAANFDTSRMLQIKETLGVTTFLIASAIANQQLVSRLEEKSAVDGLTQVSNRNTMNERVEKFVTGKTPLPDSMGVIFADLNGLKTVNDFKGHDAGDKLLTRAAAMLKIAFGDYEVYRAGGDEFVVLCPDITKDKLEQQIAQLRALADSTTDVSFAIGSEYCTGSYDIRQAMQTADNMMYKDKREYYRLHPEKDRRKGNRI